MMERGDKYQIAVCNQSGMIAIYNQEKDLFMSPAIDGPFKFTTAPDGNSLYLNDITRFGRSFSIVSIPYTFKLLMQELQTINMQMRIITEDNIEQLENMSYSKNISKLLMNPAANEDTVAEMVRMEETNRFNAKNANVPKYLESVSPGALNETQSPTDEPPPPQYSYNESPQYSYNESPQYPDVSPAYRPPSEENSPGSESPVYGRLTSKEMEEHEKVWDEWRKYYDPQEQRMTHRFDEATKTWVKNKTFEEIWSMKGGKPDFQIGESVFLRGGKRHKPHKVKHVGDKFITVETQYPSDDEDTIQVVEPYELLRPSEINPANIDGLSFDRPMFNQMDNPITSNNGYPNEQSDGKIVFAPQIVVTTGNDNNMTIPAVSNTPELMNGGQPEPSSFSGGSGAIQNISMTKMEPAKTDSFADQVLKAPEQTSSSNSSGGLLDFAKGFFIKKMT
jgi:hypothetical protein